MLSGRLHIASRAAASRPKAPSSSELVGITRFSFWPSTHRDGRNSGEIVHPLTYIPTSNMYARRPHLPIHSVVINGWLGREKTSPALLLLVEQRALRYLGIKSDTNTRRHIAPPAKRGGKRRNYTHKDGGHMVRFGQPEAEQPPSEERGITGRLVSRLLCGTVARPCSTAFMR